jgi:deoxyadenosine/deoxycytidine kinase
MTNPMHIAITGNIGAGKTSLTNRLAEHYQWEAVFEPVESNPYLTDFYADMSRWAFHAQIHFLGSRFRQMQKINQNPANVFQDRTIYEDAHIFARNVYTSGFMSSREYETYLQMFEAVVSLVRPPDLLVYLRASIPTLMKRIRMRARQYEANITSEYLQHLDDHYMHWIQGYTYSRVLVFDAEALDFVNKPSDLEYIIKQLNQEIEGHTG